MPNSSTIASGPLVNALQKRLDIPWKGAVSLLEQAKTNCEITDETIPDSREDEVLEEACEIYADLTPAEQEALQVRPAADSSGIDHPDWKEKALRIAAQREADARARQEAEAANEAVRARLREQGELDDAAVQNTRVIAIRKIECEQPMSVAGGGEERQHARVNMKTITCFCTIQ